MFICLSVTTTTTTTTTTSGLLTHLSAGKNQLKHIEYVMLF